MMCRVYKSIVAYPPLLSAILSLIYTYCWSGKARSGALLSRDPRQRGKMGETLSFGVAPCLSRRLDYPP